MFKRFFILSATAICLAAAVWLIFGFTKEQSTRVGNFLYTKAVCEMKIAPPHIAFPPFPKGRPLTQTAPATEAGWDYFVFFSTSS